MFKYITPDEIAEIVCGLLIKPGLLGELDSPEKHMAFMTDIGRVIADHCGGHINCVHHPDSLTRYHMEDEDSQPSLSVAPNDCLPSLHNNVWSLYDTEANWGDGDLDGVGQGEELNRWQKIAIRAKLQSLLSNAGLNQGISQTFDFQMVDWRTTEDHDGFWGDELEPDDGRPYRVTAQLHNQPEFDFSGEDGEFLFGLVIEINGGVPAIHVNLEGGESALHIHAAQGGLVLTPDDCYGSSFEQAELDRHSYNEPNSLVLR